ncbi:MAG: 2,5-didehydrogluconate reductase [Rubrobacteraceae bacterium]|nr:2,5-didehydrogluconate reductase [Rubrobacteraceae bacterium]
MSVVPGITLNDGNTIPQLGFGVFQIESEDTAEAVREAIEVGYRHIDTAEMYGNEREVGAGIRASGIDRGDVFVTSKLNNGLHEPDDAREAFETTLSDLGFDYVDLFLIHWPLPALYDGDFVSTWKTLEEFHDDGRARSVGVSNFQIEHLERLAAETDTVPSVNQIEVHPYFTNEAVREYGQDQQDAGAGRVAVAHPARRHSVPEVGDTIAHAGELRTIRLRDRAPRYGRDLRPRPG